MSFTNTTITDLMEVSLVKVLLDNDYLHFVIKYPKPILVCKRVILLPVQHNGTVINITNDNNVAECGNQVIVITDCKKTLTSTFCKKLPNPTCAQQLHSGATAHCSIHPSHLEGITVVDEGIVVINDNTAVIITINGSEKIVSGTYLVTFEDKVQINGSNFENHNGVIKGLPGSASTTFLNITGQQEVLSLPYLRRLSVENLRYIGVIEKRAVIGPALSTITTIIILIGCYILFKLYQKRIRSPRTALT